MNGDVIFEGMYSDAINKFSDEEENRDPIFATSVTDGDSAAYIRKILENTVSVFMPDRVERTAKFIKAAKKVAAEYLIDFMLLSHDNHVTAVYTLDSDADFYCLKEIISQADGISFQIKQEKVILSLVFYTHATYLSGRRVSPMED